MAYLERDKEKAKYRNSSSIRVELAIIFIILMVVTIGLYWIVNTLFLEKYYRLEKQRGIVKAYENIDSLAEKEDMQGEVFQKAFFQWCAAGNLDAAIISPSLDVLLSSEGEDALLVRRLLDHLFDKDDRPALLTTEKYVVRNSRDPRMQMDYLELWGSLKGGDIIIMRTALDSIRESAAISNRFLAYAGFFMIVVCAIIIWFVSKKITSPILDLAHISERMAQLDFEAKYTRGGSNELALLGKNMNELSEALERTISELKTANAELKRDIALKEKQEAVRMEFLSSVAHELKTPLALIQGYAEGLKDNVNDDPESRDYYCDVIKDESGKMNQLVLSLISLNHLESGEDALTFERFDVRELIEGCIQSNMLFIKQNGIDLSFSAEQPCFVWADEFKVEEVFMNYFSNAMHYCQAPPASDRGEDEGKRIEVKFALRQGKVRISVFNTGAPIPEESLPKLWDKFYKVDKARSREYGGSGLGLSIVKAIMEAFGREYGAINYGNGVEFFFELDSAAEP